MSLHSIDAPARDELCYRVYMRVHKDSERSCASAAFIEEGREDGEGREGKRERERQRKKGEVRTKVLQKRREIDDARETQITPVR